MSLPVDVPLLAGWSATAYPLVMGAAALIKGLVGAIVLTVLLVVVRRRLRIALGWPALLGIGAAAFVGIFAWSWLTSSEYTVVRVTQTDVELRYATWPRPARRIPLDQVESVSVTTSGRTRRGHARQLVIVTRPDGAHWESAAGNDELLTLAIQWVEHAAGGPLTRR